MCSVLHLAVVCLYLVANRRHSVGTANGLKYWQLQRPMFVIAICAAATGLAAASCYIYVFASDSAGDVFFKGFSAGGFASPPFIALLIFQPLEFFTYAPRFTPITHVLRVIPACRYVSSMVMLQLRMMDLCFNRQSSGPRTRAVLFPLSIVVAACVVCGCANAYETSRGSYGGLYSSESERGRLFTVVQLTAQFMSDLILTSLFFHSMRACRRQLLVRAAVSIQVCPVPPPPVPPRVYTCHIFSRF
jgi:hypothetical protein